MTTSHFILVDENLTATQVSDLCDELKDVDGITQVVSWIPSPARASRPNCCPTV